MRANGWKSLYWLDVFALGKQLIRKHQSLARVRYFTSRIKGDVERSRRQSAYLDALHARREIDIQYGTYSPHEVQCDRCPDQHRWLVYGEKKTDVNIATALLTDAMDDAFDVAMLVSGDGDLLAPVNVIRNRFGPTKQVWNAFPPNRPNRDLEAAATGKVRIRKWMLQNAQLPLEVPVSASVVVKRPTEWAADVDPTAITRTRHTFPLSSVGDPKHEPPKPASSD